MKKLILILFIGLMTWKCEDVNQIKDDLLLDTLISTLSGYKLTYGFEGMLDSSMISLQQAHIIFEEFPFFAETAIVLLDTIKLGGYETDSGYVNIFYRFKGVGIDSINLFETIHCLGDSCFIFPIDLTVFGNADNFIFTYYHYKMLIGGSEDKVTLLGNLNCDSLVAEFNSLVDIEDTLELYTCLLHFQ